jgi:hypothetical protein
MWTRRTEQAITKSNNGRTGSTRSRQPLIDYSCHMSQLQPPGGSSPLATVGHAVRSRPWLLLLVLALAALTLGRVLVPGAASVRVVRGTVTAVDGDSSAIGFMPDGRHDPDSPPSLTERVTYFTSGAVLADMWYGYPNTVTGYKVAGVRWADAEGTWHDGGAPPCLAPMTRGQRVELGLVWVRPGDDRPGQVVVVWLRCL